MDVLFICHKDSFRKYENLKFGKNKLNKTRDAIVISELAPYRKKVICQHFKDAFVGFVFWIIIFGTRAIHVDILFGAMNFYVCRKT